MSLQTAYAVFLNRSSSRLLSQVLQQDDRGSLGGLIYMAPQTLGLSLSIVSLPGSLTHLRTWRTVVQGRLPLILVVTVFLVLLDRFSVLLAAPPSPGRDAGEQVQSTPAQAEDWSLHFQATGIYQGYPHFPARYSGASSLSRNGQIRETVTVTGFLGRRLWPGAEVYLNPEGFQGLGFNGTRGVAGFPNGEATKAGGVEPDAAIARLFLRQVIGLGGPREWVAGDTNQLAGYRAVSRLTLTVGQLAVPDLFDANTYSHDPRTQFWNWALWEAGAWDFAANVRGYTQGAAIELNQAAWAVRYGAFLPPRTPNGNNLPLRGLTSLSHNLEMEERHEIFTHPGKVRLLGFFTRARMGLFREALHRPGDVNENIAQTRRFGHIKYGGVLNVEQELGKEVGGFLRGSWNDGRTEDWAFTQIDRSVAGGVSLRGGRWGRPEDTLGVASALNGLSGNHRKFLAAGGLGLIIGDGRLHYTSEGAVEGYYDVKPSETLSLTLDYQFITSPGYNRDRGPVHVFGARLHIEF